MDKVQQDKEIMMEEKVQMERDIQKWEADFKQQNGRDPSDDDK